MTAAVSARAVARPSDIAAGWKKRLQTRTVRTADGGEQVIARETADDILMTIRAFYLDLK